MGAAPGNRLHLERRCPAGGVRAAPIYSSPTGKPCTIKTQLHIADGREQLDTQGEGLVTPPPIPPVSTHPAGVILVQKKKKRHRWSFPKIVVAWLRGDSHPQQVQPRKKAITPKSTQNRGHLCQALVDRLRSSQEPSGQSWWV